MYKTALKDIQNGCSYEYVLELVYNLYLDQVVLKHTVLTQKQRRIYNNFYLIQFTGRIFL